MSEVPFDPLKAITLTDAAKRMRGRRGGAPSVLTLRRWANPRRGCAAGGRKIVLLTIRYGSELLTMPEWVEAFERARIKAGERTEVVLARPRREREAAHRRACERLREKGVKVPEEDE